MVDGFINKEPKGFRRRMVRTVEEGWAVPCFPREQHFMAAMTKAGFTDIAVCVLQLACGPFGTPWPAADGLDEAEMRSQA